jgi:PncC family amidohydrolase
MSVENSIHNLLITKGLTLSLAESCTGGAMAARLTQIPGASRYFLGSIICYSNLLKIKILGVSPTLLDIHGAVSEEVVRQMAQGMMDIAGSDFTLAVSGIAGPDGGSIEKPVGTVWCALGRRGQPPLAWKLQLHGTRSEIIAQSCDALLSKLLALIS